MARDIDWITWDALLKLKHIGPIRDYIKAYASLMLEVEEMSNHDWLYHIISGL